MAIRSFKQDYLYSHKGDFYVLSELEKYSLTKLAEIFGVGRSTIWEFKKSNRWKEWVFLLDGELLVKEVLKHKKDLTYKKILFWNKADRKDIKNAIEEKYSFLKDILNQESQSSQQS